MVALAGTIQGNTVCVENDNIQKYEGYEVILTVLDRKEKRSRKPINWDGYGMATERGENADQYIRELRENA